MKKSLLLIILLFLFINSNAQWTVDTTVNTVVHDTAGAATPLIATTLSGNTYVSWFEFGPTGNYDLKMQLLDTNGYKLWAPSGITVCNYPQSTALYRYDLKVDNEGNAVVAFQDIRNGGNLNVVVSKVDINGNLVWGPAGKVLIDSLSTEGLSPSIGITGQNHVVVAWNADSSSKKWIACQRLDPMGNFVWNQVYRMRDTVTNLKYSRPKLFPQGTKDVQMLYVEESGNFPGVTSTLYTQRIDTAGANMFPSAIQVSTKTIPYFFFPEPVPDDNGGFFVAFNTSNPTNPSLNDVYVQYVDFNGNLWSQTGTEAGVSTTNNKTISSACYHSNFSEFWIIMQFQDAGQANSGLNVQKFDATGNTLLGPDGIAIYPIDPTIYYLPGTITDVSDGMIISCIYGGFGNEHIIATKVDYNGALTWTDNSSICAVNSNKDDLAAGKYVHDYVVFVWQDDRNGSGIYAQNVDRAGHSGITTGISYPSAGANYIFPNPAGIPHLTFGSTGSDRKITLTDLRGSVLYSTRISGDVKSVSLDETENIPAGVYFITVHSDEGGGTVKWIKE